MFSMRSRKIQALASLWVVFPFIIKVEKGIVHKMVLQPVLINKVLLVERMLTATVRTVCSPPSTPFPN